MADYRAACERLNSELPEATLAFQPSIQMALDHSDLVQAAVSLDAGLAPEWLVEAEDVATAGILVSCTVEAQLRGGPGVFEVEEPGWVARSLVTAQTVRWSWFVTPRRLGEHHLTLQLRPVLRITDGTDQVLTEASILEESIQVTVRDPSVGDRVVRWLESTTRVLRTLEGVLLALAAVLVGSGAVKAGMWWRQRHRRGSFRSPGPDEPEGSAQRRSSENGQPADARGATTSSSTGATPPPDPEATETGSPTGSSHRPPTG